MKPLKKTPENIKEVRPHINGIDTVAGPSVPLEIELQNYVANARSQGNRDQAKYDGYAVASMGDRLLSGDIEIEADYQRYLKEIDHREAAAKSTHEGLSKQSGIPFDVEHQDGYTYTITSPTIDENLKQAKAAVEHVEARIKQSTSVLQGKDVDEDGISWTGHVPPAPGPDTTVKQVKGQIWRDFIVQHLFVVLLLFDLAVGFAIVRSYMREDGWVTIPIALVLSLVGLIVIPLVDGLFIAKAFRRGFLIARETAVIVFLTLMWCGAVAGATWMRVTVDRQDAVRRVAEATGVDPSTIDPSTVYNSTAGWLIWLVIVAVTGAAGVAIEIWLHNPTTPRLLKCYAELIGHRQSVAYWNDIKAHSNAVAQASRAADEARLANEWNAARADLQAARVQAHAAYAEGLSNDSTDPKMANAVQDYYRSNCGQWGC